MTQFTVYQNTNAQTKKLFPYLLDVQSNLLNELQTSVVVPLALTNKKTKTISRLTPQLKINGENFIMLTPQLAGINKKDLGKMVTNLSESRNEIISAIDFLITGF
jgi:toxin CcdB